MIFLGSSVERELLKAPQRSLMLTVEYQAVAESDAERLWSMSLRKAYLSVVALLLSNFMLAAVSEAASVYNCSAGGQKCVVKVEEGIIGDRVKVMDEKARVIAVGRIVKRRGAYAVVNVSNSSQTIRKGYPVIVDVENRDSNMQWAASFSNKD